MKTYSGILRVKWSQYFKARRLLERLICIGELKSYEGNLWMLIPSFKIISITEVGMEIIKAHKHDLPIKPTSYLQNTNT